MMENLKVGLKKAKKFIPKALVVFSSRFYEFANIFLLVYSNGI